MIYYASLEALTRFLAVGVAAVIGAAALVLAHVAALRRARRIEAHDPASTFD